MADLLVRIKIENTSDEARAEVKVEPVEEQVATSGAGSAVVPEVAEEPEGAGPQKKVVKKRVKKRWGAKGFRPNPRKFPPRVVLVNRGDGICAGPCAKPGNLDRKLHGLKLCHPCLKKYDSYKKSQKKKRKVW